MLFPPLVVFALCAVLLLTVYAIALWRRSPRGVPWADGWLPFVGHAFLLRKDPNAFIESQVQKFGGQPFMIQIVNRVACILSEEHIRLVQRAKDVELSMNGVFEELVGAELMSRPIKSATDNTWVHILRSQFLPRRAEFIPFFLAAVENVSQVVTKGKSPYEFQNFSDDFALYLVIEAVLLTFLGPELGKMKELQDAFIALSNVSEGILRATVPGIPLWVTRRKLWKYDAPRAIVDRYLLPEIEKRRAKGEASARGDYLDCLIFWPTNLSPPLVVAYFESLVFAALMTTKQNLSLTMIDLAARPEVQERVREEVRQEVAHRSDNGVINAKVVDHLKFTEAVVREAMRRRVGPFLPWRRLEVDLPVPGTAAIVPKGFFVAMAASSIHKSDSAFTNASAYNPDRWLADTSADSCVSFLSFGAGAHKCPGRMFALAEIKTLIASLLLTYSFTGGATNSARGDQAKSIPITMTRLN